MLLFAALLLSCLTLPRPTAAEPRPVIINGGPAGGTFQLIATAIQESPPVRKSSKLLVKAAPSAGSLENLRSVEAGKADFGVVYSGHLYMGQNGLLQDDPKHYQKVMAVAYLYGAPAQLIVRRGSGIRQGQDLVGKKVGVGMAGSGSFANCEQFFSHLGLWNRIERIQMGYLDTAAAFAEGQLDAFWLFTAFPSGAALVAAQRGGIDLIDLDVEARRNGFYDKYPYFTKVTVPAGTYRDLNHPTHTFQDSALLVAGADVPEEVVYDLLSQIYNRQSLAYLHHERTTFKEMRLASGTRGIVTPMHPGALRFWKKMGIHRQTVR